MTLTASWATGEVSGRSWTPLLTRRKKECRPWPQSAPVTGHPDAWQGRWVHLKKLRRMARSDGRDVSEQGRVTRCLPAHAQHA